MTSIASILTLQYITECIISNGVGNSPGIAIRAIPKLADRLKNEFGETKPEINSHLQKAILSAHWMSTLAFVDLMKKNNLIKASYTNVHYVIKKELKNLSDDNYHPVEISPASYDVSQLIKVRQKNLILKKLESDILSFHLDLLDKRTGEIKKLKDYNALKELILNGWPSENLNWFQLMTAFLNQLLKGDNNKAKDFYQNQILADINLKITDFKKYVKKCSILIGTKKLNELIASQKSDIKTCLATLTKTLEIVNNLQEDVKSINKITTVSISKLDDISNKVNKIHLLISNLSGDHKNHKDRLEFSRYSDYRKMENELFGNGILFSNLIEQEKGFKSFQNLATCQISKNIIEKVLSQVSRSIKESENKKKLIKKKMLVFESALNDMDEIINA